MIELVRCPTCGTSLVDGVDGEFVGCTACASRHEHGGRPPRRATAYLRFLLLDHHRAEAGRAMIALEARYQAFAASRNYHARGTSARTSRLKVGIEHARKRWDVLARLAQRARKIAQRLGCFDGAHAAPGGDE